jgi:methyl-accepting chemotaxis protein
MLLDGHMALQKMVVRIISPLCLLILIGIFCSSPVWQNGLQAAGFALASAAWFWALKLTASGRLAASVRVLVFSLIVYTMLPMLLTDGGMITGLLANCIVIIYASFFSLRLLYAAVGATIATSAIVTVVFVLDVVPRKETSLLGQGLYVFSFSAIILCVILVALRHGKRMNEALLEQIQAAYREQRGMLASAGQMEESLESAVHNIQVLVARFSDQAVEQSASIQQMSLVMEQVRDIAANTAASANETRSLANTLQDRASHSMKKLYQVEQGFGRVVEINELVRSEFDDLAAQAERIEDILRSNKELAAQIKILAVNAGIQAAKAGEYGVGFRVVAFELKAMIQRTDESLAASRKLLDGIRTKALKSAETIGRSSVLLGSHSEELSSTGQLIGEINEGFADTSMQVLGISHSAEEQQRRLDELGAGMVVIDSAAASLTYSTQKLQESIALILKSQGSLKAVLAETAARTTIGPEADWMSGD